MKLLAIDAATEACSVALSLDGEMLCRYEVAPRGHAQRLLPMVDELLAEAGVTLRALDAIAFDRGPGSFTGVRVGTSVAQGLAFGVELPVIPISSLAAIAQGVLHETGASQVLSVIDARMGEVYWGAYLSKNGLMELQGAEHVSKADAVTMHLDGVWFGAGSGWQVYETILRTTVPAASAGHDPTRLPHARDIIAQAEALFSRGEHLTPERALPTYLRNEVAHKQAGG